jgi:hypothetical protein
MCTDRIDALIIEHEIACDSSFILCVKELGILFTGQMLNRAYALHQELQKYDLVIRKDSVRCIDYIKGHPNALSLLQVVDSVREMHWFFNHTDYSRRLSRPEFFDARDNYELSKLVKESILKEYITSPENFQVAPPQTNFIVSSIKKINEMNKGFDVIRNWNGNIDVNVYTELNGLFLTKQYKSLIKELLTKTIDSYARGNYQKFLECDIDIEIQTIFKKELEIYPELKIICLNAISKYIDIFLEQYCQELDYRKDADWYKNYNTHCKYIIHALVSHKIAKSYNKSKVISQFLSVEKDYWKSHMRGCDIFKNVLCDHIEFIADEYVKDLVKNSGMYYIEDIQNVGLTRYLTDKLKKYFAEYRIKNISNCIQEIFTKNLDKVKTLTFEEKVNLFVKDTVYSKPVINKIKLEILKWCSQNILSSIGNQDHLNYLNKINFCNRDTHILRKYLRNSKFFIDNLPQIKCTHVPSPSCDNYCCKRCCNCGCKYHKSLAN